ncbi:MAG TPA: ABC transporter permease [Spirochaetota bacterium]|nr:ABC transporter permease [Spirochaetota bacterium]HOS31638.1 ABC transporter permease [Spirochaetota bacterium]HOS54910.1 ABC transporter permease [Spirochaetota bacterium]HQF77252.1 ABC transporter permease [Spirochaetota bacterium]HQJ06021.1 ABC transporter permease [Spirochaetota bacterium]
MNYKKENIKKTIDTLKFRLFVAKRYMNDKSRNRGSLVFISLFLGLSIGLSVMIVVISIMNGFQDNHISKRVEIGSSHINISKKDDKSFTVFEIANMKKSLYEKFEQIESVVPYSDREIIFQVDRNIFQEIQILKLRALDPDEIAKDSRFNKYFRIVNGKFQLGEYDILIGEPLSERVTVRGGDELLLSPDISLRSYKSKGIPFNISGIFETGSYDYDRYWGFISIYSLLPLTGKISIDNVGIKLKNRSAQKYIIRDIKGFLGDDYRVLSAEEMNKGYFAALKLEKVMIIFLFMIIFIMVSLNTYGALKLSLAEKKRDISILKAIGASPEDINMIFTLESVIIGFLGCFFGVVLGFFIGANVSNIFVILEKIINVSLAYIEYLLEFAVPGLSFQPVVIYDTSIYYQTSFVIKIGFFETLSIAFVVLLMTVTSAFIPVFRASKLKPNEILRS